MIGDAPKSHTTDIPGWETQAEEEALIALAVQYVPEKNGVIVELGCEYGRSTSQFAYACAVKQNTRIVSVDLFPDDHHYAKAFGGLLNVWQQNLWEYGAARYAHVNYKRGLTWEIGNIWDGTPIDLLFIDAGHTYEEVKRDIEAWIGFVRPGGVVVFHDYAKNADAHPLHHEVKRAVDEWFNTVTREWVAIDLPDSLIAFEYVPVAQKVSGTEKLQHLRANAIVLEDEPEHDTPADVEPVPGVAEPTSKPARRKRSSTSKRK